MELLDRRGGPCWGETRFVRPFHEEGLSVAHGCVPHTRKPKPRIHQPAQGVRRASASMPPSAVCDMPTGSASLLVWQGRSQLGGQVQSTAPQVEQIATPGKTGSGSARSCALVALHRHANTICSMVANLANVEATPSRSAEWSSGCRRHDTGRSAWSSQDWSRSSGQRRSLIDEPRLAYVNIGWLMAFTAAGRAVCRSVSGG
jgi:hypothetical protein